MKKSLFSLILTAVLIAVGAVPAHAVAVESAASASRLEEAKKYYIASAVDGLPVVQKFNGQTFTAAQIESARKAITGWCNAEFEPFLRRSGILDEWIEMQFDAQIREFNRRLVNAENPEQFMKIAAEANVFIRKNYPNTDTKLKTPDGIKEIGRAHV